MIRTSIITLIALGIAAGARAQSNIAPSDKHAWCENIGWTNWRDAQSGMSGVLVNATFLEGYIWSENAGWINVGNGSGPYTNATGLTFGVNIGASGFLDGFAWGENIGWINFGTQPFIGADGARYDANSNRFRGYAWGENVGWINLDDNTFFVGTVCTGDTNGDNLVNFTDLNTVLTNFGMTGPPGSIPGDFNADGVVNFTDLNLVLTNFGVDCV
jgi:hypothetical protein